MRPPTVVTLTMNPAVDKSVRVDRVRSGDRLRCDRPSWDPDGGGVNVARVIQRLGGQAMALYPAGGPLGEVLGQLLDDEGVAHRRLPIDGWTRESFTVTERSTGLQYRVSMPGPRLGDRRRGPLRHRCRFRHRDVARHGALPHRGGRIAPSSEEGYFACPRSRMTHDATVIS